MASSVAKSHCARFGAAIIVLAAAFGCSFMWMPIEDGEEPYVPPSRFFLGHVFSMKIAAYRERAIPDVLVLGNSRVDAGINPDILSESLSTRYSRKVVVHSLATGGGYFPFYELLVTRLLADRLPRHIVLGLSPRDFNRLEPRATSVAGALRDSSGMILADIPYAEPFHSVEARLADLSAALFPGLYYRDPLLRRLLQDRIPADQSVDSAHMGAFVRVARELEADFHAMLPRLTQPRDEYRVSLGTRWQRYVARFPALIRFDTSRCQAITSTGWLIRKDVGPDSFIERKRTAVDQWRKVHGCAIEDALPCRRSPDYERYFALWPVDDSPIDRTLSFLDKRGVTVTVVFLPAMLLEDWENNTYVWQVMIDHLESLRARHPSLRAVIDLNCDFKHNFMDMQLYTDLEHLTPAAATDVTHLLAGKIVLDSPAKSMVD